MMIQIRDATEADIPQILEIEQEAISPPWMHSTLLREIYNEDALFIVAADECSTCGFAILRQVGDDGELLQIAVCKSKRGGGIGGLLMKYVLGYAAEKTLSSVFLEVRKSNTAAVRLYEEHGFKSIRTRKAYYTDPIEDASVMMKHI